jgi:hypothetical protein
MASRTFALSVTKCANAPPERYSKRVILEALQEAVVWSVYVNMALAFRPRSRREESCAGLDTSTILYRLSCRSELALDLFCHIKLSLIRLGFA